ncbi:hypothetical protein GMMP15_1700018 [Candidatus Magnetomoraceae bacterium gMMP-15]
MFKQRRWIIYILWKRKADTLALLKKIILGKEIIYETHNHSLFFDNFSLSLQCYGRILTSGYPH